MAVSADQALHFTDRRKKGQSIADLPKFDLDTYALNYDIQTRILRLQHIAQLCPALALDALHLAIPAAKYGKDPALYLSLVNLMRNMDPSDPLATPDSDWVDKATKLNEQETLRLEHELRGYKNNLIKESIRMGQEDLGTHHLKSGNMDPAAKAFQKMREYCTTPKHVAEMTTKLVYTYILFPQWLQVLSHCQRLRSLSLKPEDKARFDAVATACSALASIGQGGYRSAANTFLTVNPAYATIGQVAGIDFANTIMSANDIAVYGGLCALASMDRQELQKLVLDNADFRNFLELEPHIRRAITLFCGAKYTQSLAILESYRNDYLLDVFLSPHVNTLYQKIRSKSIVQYFLPFSSVTLSALETAFPIHNNATTSSALLMEEELIDMIQRGLLDARIDTVNKVLQATPHHSRHDAHRGVMDTADDVEHQLRLKLHKINMAHAGLEIQAPKTGGGKGKGNSANTWGSSSNFTPGLA